MPLCIYEAFGNCIIYKFSLIFQIFLKICQRHLWLEDWNQTLEDPNGQSNISFPTQNSKGLKSIVIQFQKKVIYISVMIHKSVKNHGHFIWKYSPQQPEYGSLSPAHVINGYFLLPPLGSEATIIILFILKLRISPP